MTGDGTDGGPRERRWRRSRRTPGVLVTDARVSHAEDIRARQRRYFMTQGGRVVCILLAGLLPLPVLARMGFIVAACLLPWFGVIAANAGPSAPKRRRRAPSVAAPEQVAITPGAAGAIVVDADPLD